MIQFMSVMNTTVILAAVSSCTVAGTVMMTHQLVGLSLQVSGEGQQIHKCDSFIYLKQQNQRHLQM